METPKAILLCSERIYTFGKSEYEPLGQVKKWTVSLRNNWLKMHLHFVNYEDEVKVFLVLLQHCKRNMCRYQDFRLRQVQILSSCISLMHLA